MQLLSACARGLLGALQEYFNDALQALPKDKRGPEQLPARFIEFISRLYKVEAQARRDTLDAHALQQQGGSVS